MKKKKVELPLVKPIYSTYNYQSTDGAVCFSNPSIENWYYNELIILCCSKKFLSGYTTPELTILNSKWKKNPYLEKITIHTRHLGGYVNCVIRKLLDLGYYICFSNVDDYYVENKSWYKKRHFSHDGLICGYNQEDKTYTIYAYDENWICQKFKAPQASFNNGRMAMEKQGIFMNLHAIKPTNEQVEFDTNKVICNIREYLKCEEDDPANPTIYVCGIAVMEYIEMYIDKLIDGSIPYERIDNRVVRIIWEHKKVMLERLRRAENALRICSKASEAYEKVVAEADYIRVLYASYNIKRRDSVLPIIKEKLLNIRKNEETILLDFLKYADEKTENEK